MPVTPHRRARVIAALMGVSALIAACGASSAPPRLEAAGSSTASAPAAVALGVIAEDDATITENVVPDLLGFDPPDQPPVSLAMTEEPAVVEGTDDSTAVEPGDAAESDQASDADASTASAGDSTGDEAGDNSEPREFAVLPLPLPAASGSAALYDDPSELFVGAAARPFPTDLEGDGVTQRGLTREAIRVGGLVSATVSGAALRDAACLGAEARYRQANVNSELSRRIDFVACHDDTGRAEIAEGLAGSLVRDDEVFAIAPLSSVAFVGDVQLSEAAVPHIGDGALPAWCGRHTPFGFGIGGAVDCPVLDARGYTVLSTPVLTALAAGSDDLGQIMVMAPAGPDGAATLRSRRLEAELSSMAEPIAGPALPDVADGPPSSWGPVVAEVLDAAPDTVLLEGGVTTGLPAALRARGFDGQLVLVGALDPLDIADDETRATLAPLTVVTPGLDLASRTSDGWTALVAAAAGVDVAPEQIGLDFVRGYGAADVLVRALAATAPPLSAEALVDTMNGGWWYPGVDGVTCGAWWPAAHYSATPCVSVARVDAFSSQLIPVVDLVETMPQLRFGL